jgi:ferritin-like protein
MSYDLQAENTSLYHYIVYFFYFKLIIKLVNGDVSKKIPVLNQIRHEDVWWSEGIAPRIFNLGITLR